MSIVSDKAGDKKTIFEKASIIFSPIMQLVTLIILLVTITGIYKDTRRDVDELQKAVLTLSGDIKGISRDNHAEDVEVNKRVSIISDSVKTLQGDSSKLADRLVRLESNAKDTDKYVREIQASMATFSNTLVQQSGDLKLIREILQRVESQSKGK